LIPLASLQKQAQLVAPVQSDNQAKRPDDKNLAGGITAI
jgi:hypothetical protein